MVKKALIFGVTGQDGTYLAQYLLKKNYIVYGTSRSFSHRTSLRLKKMGIYSDIKKFKVKLGNPKSVQKAIQTSKPDEIYNLAGISSVSEPFNKIFQICKENTIGVLTILEEIRKNSPHSRFFQASSAEMFGSQCGMLDEKSEFKPNTPYAISKVFSHNMTKTYRENFGIFTCNGILFNHESPLRGENFVTKKITKSLTHINLKKLKQFNLGNINAKRDWGFAGDYVKAMWLMLQQKSPDDFVIATGKSHSIKDFLDVASFQCKLDWKHFVNMDNSLKRSIDLPDRIGNSNKAKKILKWKPKMSFENLIKLMVKSDFEESLNLTKKQQFLKNF